jgi:hypothetical protein
MTKEKTLRRAPERDDIDVRKIALIALALAFVLVLAGGIALFAWESWRPDATIEANSERFDARDGGPLLESAPQADRLKYAAGKQRLLEQWQWVDARKGIARIPIEQAMDIMAARPPDGGRR